MRDGTLKMRTWDANEDTPRAAEGDQKISFKPN